MNSPEQPAEKALLAEGLRRYLREQQMSAAQLARALRLSVAEVEGWMAGLSYPGAGQKRILRAMGVSIELPAHLGDQPVYWVRYSHFLQHPGRMAAWETLLALWEYLLSAGLPCSLSFGANGQVMMDFFQDAAARARVSFDCGSKSIRLRFTSPFLRDTLYGEWIELGRRHVNRLIRLIRQALTQPPPAIGWGETSPVLGGYRR